MRLLIALLSALSLQAAVIQGVVLDEETGNPLARTQVALIPLPGTPAGTVALRAGDRGSFSILNVRPGWYILKTSRRGFADTEAGQLRPGRPGMPFEITADSPSNFFQIRMRHLAAITGSVLDDNGVGIPEWPVLLYTSRRPVRRILEVKTDERGNFRIGSLEAGAYVVRSGAGLLEDDTSLLATYYKYGTALETSEAVHARLGETQPDVVIRAAKGRLLQLGGIFSSAVPARLIMITDTGRRQIAAVGMPGTPSPFDVPAVPPGPVEFLAEGETAGAECGSYTRMIADKDTGGIRIGCGPLFRPSIDWQGTRNPVSAPILARRVDLDGTGPVRALRNDQPLPPGHWELTMLPPAPYYLSMIRSQFSGEPSSRNDGWFGVFLGNQTRLQITLSSRSATVSGVVMASGKPVAGASVYLEMFNPDLPEKRLQLWSARSDSDGNYTFSQLGPGRYRVLSTFDFDPEDELLMEKAEAVTLREGETAAKALEMQFP